MVKPLKDARDRYESMKEQADKEKAAAWEVNPL